MKRIFTLFMISMLSIGFTTGCSSNHVEETADDLVQKHAPFPEHIANTPEYIQETYLLAAEHHEALEVSPCYCNCYESAGHMSNRDCFIKEMGPNNEVLQWDPHGTA